MAVSINQFNQWSKNNAVIAFYKQIRTSHNNWRNRYFNVGSRGGYPVVSNSIYAEIQKLAKILTGINVYGTPCKRASLEYEGDWSGKKVRINLTAYLDVFEGAYIKVEPERLRFEGKHYFFFPIHSRKSWQEFDVAEYFNRYLERLFIFPEGRYREIQIYLGTSPTDTITRCKDELRTPLKPTAIDTTPSIIKRLRKKRNIIVVDDMEFSDRSLMRLFESFPDKFSVRKKVRKAPNPFDILEGFDGDVDEIESLVYSSLGEFDRNTILI